MIVEDFVECLWEVIRAERVKTKMAEKCEGMVPATAERMLYSRGGEIRIDNDGVMNVVGKI